MPLGTSGMHLWEGDVSNSTSSKSTSTSNTTSSSISCKSTSTSTTTTTSTSPPTSTRSHVPTTHPFSNPKKLIILITPSHSQNLNY